MKKQYRIITVVINLLLLVLFVVLEGVYTYGTATTIINEKWQEVNEYAGWSSVRTKTNNLKKRALPKVGNALFLSCDESSSHATCNIMCKLPMAYR